MSSNPSAMLADALSVFSKAAYKSFSEVESQSRQEVTRISAEIHEIKVERDKSVRELHACQLESQSSKQEMAASKATLSQAELTIAHQAETVSSQAETIAQLRRELTQWKDQSRNWQEHFLRVEQERCVQSSRIDELVAEKLQYARSVVNANSLFSPKSTKYTNGVNSAPSTTRKGSPNLSPTQPPAYKSAAPPSPVHIGSAVVTPSQNSSNGRNAKKQARNVAKPQQDRDVPPIEDLPNVASTSLKRPRRSTIVAQSAQKAEQPAAVIRSSTVVRRVQAVINVKREDDSDEEGSSHDQLNNVDLASSSSGRREDDGHPLPTTKGRTSRSKVVHDNSVSEDLVSDDLPSESESDAFGPTKAYNHPGSGRFRNRSRVNYKEDDEEEEEEEDELIMGAEENHEEVYGTKPVEDSRTKQPTSSASGRKRRRVAGH